MMPRNFSPVSTSSRVLNDFSPLKIWLRGLAMLRLMTQAWLFLVLGRYTFVTSPALWGRELNIYWDLRFLPDVIEMLLQRADVGIVRTDLSDFFNRMPGLRERLIVKVLLHQFAPALNLLVAAARVDLRLKRLRFGIPWISLQCLLDFLPGQREFFFLEPRSRVLS